MPALSKVQLETKKKKREKRLQDARNRIDLNLGKGKRTAKSPVSKKKPVDRYRRTGGFGMSQGQKTKIDLEKKKKRDAAIAKREASKPTDRIHSPTKTEKPKLSRRQLTEQRAAKSRPKIKEQAKQLKIKAEDKSKFVEGGLRAAQKRAQENVGTAASLLIGGPALGLGIKAVSGGFKLGDKIYKTVSAARNAANKAKKLRQKEALKKTKEAEAQRKKLEAANKRKKTKGPKVSAQTKGGRGKVTEKPGERQTWLQKLKEQRQARAKKKADAKKKTEAQAKKDAKKKDNGRTSSEKTLDAATAHQRRVGEAATKGRGKGTGTSTTTKPKPTVSLKDRILARPINTKTGKPYGPRSAQYKNWRNKVDKYKARGKGAAKLGAAGAAGYGLSELLRDRQPGQKPKPPTDRFQGAVKTTAKPKTKTTSSQPPASARKEYVSPKTKINGMMAPVDRGKPGRTIGTQAGGKGPSVKGQVDPTAVGPGPKVPAKYTSADYKDFLSSRGGIKGFQRNLFGKNKTLEEGTKRAREAYDEEQRDRKRDPDKYQYGAGRRSKLKKGGVVGKSKGGMVRFSTGGRVLDTYDYN